MRRSKQTIVVVGNGTVGLRFCEQMIAFDESKQYRLVTFGEDPRAAYDRVGLTSFVAHRDAQKLMLARRSWYENAGVEIHLGDRADTIDREDRCVIAASGFEVPYDNVVLATGSYPVVPPIPGVQMPGVFVFRTDEDRDHIIEHAARSRSCAVIGGGLLGLKAAQAVFELGPETHVIEAGNRLLPRQLDEAGSALLRAEIEALGIRIHLSRSTRQIHGSSSVAALELDDGEQLEVDMVIVAAGVIPRDELARQCGLRIGSHGGIVVDDRLQTSDPNIFAIGECALHETTNHGLFATGYLMAETAAANFCGDDQRFRGAVSATGMQLPGVEIAVFGVTDFRCPKDAYSLIRHDPNEGTYSRLFLTPDRKRLLGGILVGDTSGCRALAALAQSSIEIPYRSDSLPVCSRTPEVDRCSTEDLPDDTSGHSRERISRSQLREIIQCGDRKCGGNVGDRLRSHESCLPLITELLSAEVKQTGQTEHNHPGDHFTRSRSGYRSVIRTGPPKSAAALPQSCTERTGGGTYGAPGGLNASGLRQDRILSPQIRAAPAAHQPEAAERTSAISSASEQVTGVLAAADRLHRENLAGDPWAVRSFRLSIDTECPESRPELSAEHGGQQPAALIQQSVWHCQYLTLPICENSWASAAVPEASFRVDVGIPAEFPDGLSAGTASDSLRGMLFTFPSKGEWYVTQNVWPAGNCCTPHSQGESHSRVAGALHRIDVSLPEPILLQAEPHQLGMSPDRTVGKHMQLRLMPMHTLTDDRELASPPDDARSECGGSPDVEPWEVWLI